MLRPGNKEDRRPPLPLRAAARAIDPGPGDDRGSGGGLALEWRDVITSEEPRPLAVAPEPRLLGQCEGARVVGQA